MAKIEGHCDGPGEAHVAAACVPVGNLLGNSMPDYEGQMGLKVINQGWYKYNNSFVLNEDVGENPGDPVLKVYDYTDSNLYDLNSYNVQCNELVQVVDAGGNNKAWASRSSNISVSSTPDFFLGYTSLEGYGYSAFDPPYGSASLKSGWSNGVVNFNNYQNNFNIGSSAAGLPYGCEANTGDGCKLLGFCENDPSVLCIYSDTVMDSATCKNIGSCELLDFDSSYEAKDILKNIFLTSYNSQKFNGTNWQSSGTNFDFSQGTGSIPVCPNINERISDTEWCFIPPQIENISLEKNDEPVTLNIDGYDVPQSGEYQLKFNTIIDGEQAPLGDIIIDWDDDSGIQIISNQDYHPDPNYPHIITHSYIYPEGSSKNIKIKIFDNWGFNRCCAPAETPVCGYQNPDDPIALQCPNEI